MWRAVRTLARSAPASPTSFPCCSSLLALLLLVIDAHKLQSSFTAALCVVKMQSVHQHTALMRPPTRVESMASDDVSDLSDVVQDVLYCSGIDKERVPPTLRKIMSLVKSQERGAKALALAADAVHDLSLMQLQARLMKAKMDLLRSKGKVHIRGATGT
jgi:hypothetical protein